MPYFNADNNKIERPGNYVLTDVAVIPYARGSGGSELSRQIITDQIVEFSIYESIDEKFLTGDMTIVDGVNLINMIPLTGFERIEFKLYTPGEQRGYDFSVLTGHPMMITGIRNKVMIKDRIQSYVLEFCSMERVKDDLTRISKAYEGTTDQFVADIVTKNLDSKKDLIIEETKTKTKYVAPTIRPSEVIEDISDLSESKNFQSAGYHFYETGYGFCWKTFESMFCNSNGTPREVRARYSPKIVTQRDKAGDKDIINALQSVESFKILSQYDTLRHLEFGTFANKTIVHDIFNKAFNTITYDYHKQYQYEKHLEEGEGNGVVPFFNFSKGFSISDFPDMAIHYQSATDKVHDNYNFAGSVVTDNKRIPQRIALSTIVLEIEVPGFTGISVGEVVHFTHPSFKPIKKSTDKDFDPYLTGRYLITSIRHMVDIKLKKKHKMVVELVKDSFNRSLPEETMDLFTGQENEKGESYLQYSLDT